MTVPPAAYSLIRDELEMMTQFLGIGQSGGQPIVAIEFANYICLLVVEHARYLGLDLRNVQSGLDNQPWLKRGRVMSKDLRGGQSVSKTLQQIENFILQQRSAWEDTHKGRRIEGIFRRVQPDMGLYFIGSQFLANTSSLSMHSAFPSQVALDLPAQQESGARLLEFGKFIGASAATIAQSLRLSSLLDVREASNGIPNIISIDVRTQSVYDYLQKRWPDLRVEVGILLLSLLTRLRCRTVLAGALRKSGSNLALAKLEFLTVWSTIDSLRKLIAWGSHPVNTGLPAEIATMLNALLEKPTVKSLSTQGRLRNYLVHYGHKPTKYGASEWILNRHQLIDYYSDYQTVPMLHQASISAIAALDNELNEILRCAWEWSRQWKVYRFLNPPSLLTTQLNATRSILIGAGASL